ncbi:type-III secretion protein [Yersinia intermedia]|nr:type-III secretion protein [Yersinia intermedia]
MAVRFKLRLLNGELSGRELMLPEGVFTLGGQQCDVLLPLPQGQILTLRISDEHITLQTSGDVWIKGDGMIYNRNSLSDRRLKLRD